MSMTQLPNERTLSVSLAFSIGWALFWRWFLVGALPGAVIANIMTVTGLMETWLFPLFQLPLSFLGLAIAVYWLFHGGRFSSLRVVLMEQAHYQELTDHVAQTTRSGSGVEQ